MKRSTWKKRALASALALTMAASVLPTAGFAAGESTVPLAGDPEGSEGLHLNKTATLKDDGTYTIQLEAYATGNVEVETVKTVKPTDIVLVLDQSGSMTNGDYYISGIPTGRYTQVNGSVTIQEVDDGGYYYRVGDTYYRLRVDQETLESTTTWVGADGKTYDQVANTWTDYYGSTCTIGGYYAVGTLRNYHRESGDWGFGFRYVNDIDPDDRSDTGRNAAQARTNFENEYARNGYEVFFNNAGSDRDPKYTAAVYMPVTQQTVSTYRYTFYYVDANGEKVTVSTQDGAETQNCNVSPLYIQRTTRGPRLDALQYAAETFLESIRANAVANEVDHRVAVVGFASNSMAGTNWQGQTEYYWCNTELFVGSTQYNYNRDGAGSNGGDIASNHYNEAFQNVRSAQGYSNLEDSINSLAGKGATYPQYGFDMASGVFNANGGAVGEQGRSRVVIFLTDGEPGASGYDRNAASAAVTSANTVKNTYGATVYTVAVLSSAPSTGSNVDQFLKNTSSNNSYTLATNAQELENFFETVDDEITNTTTTVELTENAVLKDVLGSDFTFPADYDVQQNVTVQKAQYLGNGSFAAPEVTTGTKVERNGNTIDVSGFNYVATENLVTENGGENSAPTGYKLVVTIEGVLAKDSAATGEQISTNDGASGIYDLDKGSQSEYLMIKAFPQPKVSIGSSIYVLDYAKEATLNVDTMTQVNRLDGSEDLVFSQVDQNDTSLSMTYGNAEAKEGKLTYEPKTMDWKDYDTFYALGKDGANVNQWSKISVMPANNVYYEDDFATTTGTGIVYGGGQWETVYNDGQDHGDGNTETPNNDIHGGWENTDLANDTQYSDGSAHATGDGMATATFTFTGTGVDVYGRTNNSTGIVVADLYTMKNGQGIFSKTLAVDTSSESGDYYQIPTLFFSGLEYGTYKVVLTVATEGSDNFTFYLDGVRVYNPIQGDSDVDEVYGDEAGAMFQSVRDILLTESDVEKNPDVKFVNGAVFIDQLPNEGGNITDVVGTYKDYGPKNEVYLAQDQAIAFTLTDADYAYIGLKAPEGHATVNMTNEYGVTGEVSINHSTDLYYKVVPNSEGQIVIKNVGEDLLSITKLRVTGGGAVGESSLTSLMSYMSIMDTLPEVPYVNDDTGATDEGGNVDIENPDQDQSQDAPTQGNSFMDFLKDIFESIWNLF